MLVANPPHNSVGLTANAHAPRALQHGKVREDIVKARCILAAAEKAPQDRGLVLARRSVAEMLPPKAHFDLEPRVLADDMLVLPSKARSDRLLRIIKRET